MVAVLVEITLAKHILLRGQGNNLHRLTSHVRSSIYLVLIADHGCGQACPSLSRRFALTSRSADLPSANDRVDDISHSVVVADTREQRRTRVPHLRRVTLHHVQRRADIRGKVNLPSALRS